MTTLTVHIDELHDGRYIAWAVWPSGDVDNIVSPSDDMRNSHAVFGEIADLMLDSGEMTVIVHRHRRGG